MISQGSILKGFKDNFKEYNKVENYDLSMTDYSWSREKTLSQGLRTLLKFWIFELKFITKAKRTRHMVCTNNIYFISKVRKGLAKKGIDIKFNNVSYNERNIIVAYDLIAQEFKSISLKQLKIFDSYRFKVEETDVPPVIMFFAKSKENNK